MTATEKSVAACVRMVMSGPCVMATKYLDPLCTVKVTRRMYKKGIRRKTNDPIEMVVTIGKPNFSERKFIKLCKKSGESFPVKKIQLKFKK